MGAKPSRRRPVEDPSVEAFPEISSSTATRRNYRFLLYGIDATKDVTPNGAQVPAKDSVTASFATFLSSGHAMSGNLELSSKEIEKYVDIYGFLLTPLFFKLNDDKFDVQISLFHMTNCPHWCYDSTRYCFAVFDLSKPVDLEVLKANIDDAIAQSAAFEISKMQWCLIGFDPTQDVQVDFKVVPNAVSVERFAREQNLECQFFTAAPTEVARARSWVALVAERLTFDNIPSSMDTIFVQEPY